ncbi:hypothetical protein FTX61_18005 [Nitriliruptoraceae bacterium ZYF776]|nr:hypothetical protein [Profundirhabdus halotolerans]
MATERFPFDFQAPYDRLLSVVGFRDERCEVVLDDDELHARFGRFEVATPWSNVRDASVTGPFRAFRVIGPHLSLADRGVTFGTNARAGTCIRFHEPVAGLFGRSRRVHPGLTVTVHAPAELAAAVQRRIAS